jgi:hypothetical protein
VIAPPAGAPFWAPPHAACSAAQRSAAASFTNCSRTAS